MKRTSSQLACLFLIVFTLAACAQSAPAIVPQTTAVAEAPAAAEAAAVTEAVAPTEAPAATDPTGATTETIDAPAAAPSTYQEAPQLAELVSQGSLPPVAERLPSEPKLVTPLNEVGKYGGEQRGAHFGPQTGQLDTEALRMQSLIFIEPDLQTLTPNILKAYEASDDFKTWTLTLRQGMKWSDGTAFTTDDFMFWYEDIFLNTDLTPTPLVVYSSGGEPMKMTKVDEVSLSIEFTQPNPNFDLTMARSYGNDRMFAPKHYLQKWHIKYNEQANDVAKAENYETWALAFAAHDTHGQAQNDTSLPDITPWVLAEIDNLGNKYFERNPYYWAVDTAGNQLPYMDRQVGVLVKDAEVRTLKFISQEFDNAGENPLPVKDYTLYVENETKGNYKVFLFNNTRGNDVGFSFNQTHKDPVLKTLFQDIRFRQAMSLAIDRQQINDVLYFGKANIRNATISDSVSFYEDWMGQHFAEYDAAKANALLDEIGLTLDAATNVRTRSDGKPLEITLECWEEFCPHSEMVAEMWTAVGVKTAMRQIERTLWLERNQANEADTYAHPFDGIAEPNLRAANCGRIRPFNTDSYAPLWRTWYNTDGAEGEEPTADNQKLMELCDQFATASPESAEYATLGKEIATLYTNQLYSLGAAVAPRVIILSNRLGNTPTEGTFSGDYSFWVPFRGDQWYVK